MLNINIIFLFLLFLAITGWLWHTHGLRERALDLVKQHCIRNGLLLLDGNVALRSTRLLADGLGRKRLARIYSFEFTVTGEHRHVGRITLFGYHLGGIELSPHPFTKQAELLTKTIFHTPAAPQAINAQVIDLSDWRQRYQR